MQCTGSPAELSSFIPLPLSDVHYGLYTTSLCGHGNMCASQDQADMFSACPSLELQFLARLPSDSSRVNSLRFTQPDLVLAPFLT